MKPTRMASEGRRIEILTKRSRPALDWLVARPIAHRGLHDGNKCCFENSLSAFEAAASAGFAIECDVQPLLDGSVAVFHDDDLTRLTGETGAIRSLSANDLGRLRLGGTEHAPPTLDAMMRAIDGRVPVVVELKGFGPNQHDLPTRVAGVLARFDTPSAIMSFDHDLVARFAEQAPDLPHGLTAEGTDRHSLERHRRIAERVDFLSYNVNHLPNPFVAEFRGSGRPVITWTVRTPEQVAATRAHADQMTFEGFDPREGPRERDDASACASDPDE